MYGWVSTTYIMACIIITSSKGTMPSVYKCALRNQLCKSVLFPTCSVVQNGWTTPTWWFSDTPHAWLNDSWCTTTKPSCGHYVICILNNSVALGISIGMTSVVLIQERKDGLMDRTWVAGVNVTEIIISQVITQFFILLVQIILMLVFLLWVFKVGMQMYFCQLEALLHK